MVSFCLSVVIFRLQLLQQSSDDDITLNNESVSANATHVLWQLPTFQITSHMSGNMTIRLTAYNDLSFLDSVFSFDVAAEGEMTSGAARSTRLIMNFCKNLVFSGSIHSTVAVASRHNIGTDNYCTLLLRLV